MNQKTAPAPTDSPRSSIREILRMFLIGLGVAIAIAVFAVVTASLGIVIDSRWLGLSFWSGFIAWIILKQYTSDQRNLRFWCAFPVVMFAHLTVFILVLRSHPEWRAAWFPLAVLVETPILFVAVDVLANGLSGRTVHRRRRPSETPD